MTHTADFGPQKGKDKGEGVKAMGSAAHPDRKKHKSKAKKPEGKPAVKGINGPPIC